MARLNERWGHDVAGGGPARIRRRGTLRAPVFLAVLTLLLAVAVAGPVLPTICGTALAKDGGGGGSGGSGGGSGGSGSSGGGSGNSGAGSSGPGSGSGATGSSNPGGNHGSGDSASRGQGDDGGARGSDSGRASGAGSDDRGGAGESRSALGTFGAGRSDDDNDGLDHERARDAVLKGEAVPFASVLATVARTVPGQVIGVRMRSLQGGEPSYDIKVLDPSGVIRSVLVDAKRNRVVRVR